MVAVHEVQLLGFFIFRHLLVGPEQMAIVRFEVTSSSFFPPGTCSTPKQRFGENVTSSSPESESDAILSMFVDARRTRVSLFVFGSGNLFIYFPLHSELAVKGSTRRYIVFRFLHCYPVRET